MGGMDSAGNWNLIRAAYLGSITRTRSAQCRSPPWSEAELRHKLDDAGRLDRHPKPKGHLAVNARTRKSNQPRPPGSKASSLESGASNSETATNQIG